MPSLCSCYRAGDRNVSHSLHVAECVSVCAARNGVLDTPKGGSVVACSSLRPGVVFDTMEGDRLVGDLIVSDITDNA